MSETCTRPPSSAQTGAVPLVYPTILPPIDSPERARGPGVRISQGLFNLLAVVAANPGATCDNVWKAYQAAYPGSSSPEGIRKQLQRLWSLGLAWETRATPPDQPVAPRGRKAPPKRWYTLALAYSANLEQVAAGRPVGSKNKVNWGAKALKQRLADAAHPKVEATAPQGLMARLADDGQG